MLLSIIINSMSFRNHTIDRHIILKYNLSSIYYDGHLATTKSTIFVSSVNNWQIDYS